ncbi:MAG TPA: hypothetical protein VMP01_04860 [Pirellulaceae bacterium]|nr:hypothetical protein [Pirellulaceae bacterium]
MSPSPLTRFDLLVALALAALVIVAGSWQMAPGVCGACHDDAIYVSTAKALAQGQGYRMIDVPGSPPQTKYPIAYPAVLAALWRLWPTFPDNLVLMQGITLLTGAGTVALGYLYLVRFGYFSRTIAAGAGTLCATAPTFLYYSVQTMAEMPFALLSIAALWGLELALERTSSSRGAQFGVGVLLAMPFLCRTIGATLIVGGLWVWFWKGRPLRWCLTGVLVATLPWILWSLSGRGDWDRDPVEGYYTDYVGQWSIGDVSTLFSVVFCNALFIVYGSAHLVLEGASTLAKPGLGSLPTAIVLMLPGAAAWLAMTPGLRQGRVLPWALAAYLAAMLVWSWHPGRFLVPILPCLAAYLLSVPAAVVSRLGLGIGSQRAAAIGLALIAIANGALLVRHAGVVSRTGYPLANITDTQADWASFRRVFAWLAQHSQPTDVVACGLDSMVGLYAGRQAFRPVVYNPGQLFYGQSAAKSMDRELAEILECRRPRFLVQLPMPGHPWEQPLNEAVDALRRTHPHWLVVVYQDADPRFVIYQLDRSRSPEAGLAASP